MDTLTYRTKNVKYHQGGGGIGLRWPVKIQPLGSATEDKGCGHKGPGRKSSPHEPCVHQVRGSCYALLYVSQMYALCIEQPKLMK